LLRFILLTVTAIGIALGFAIGLGLAVWRAGRVPCLARYSPRQALTQKT